MSRRRLSRRRCSRLLGEGRERSASSWRGERSAAYLCRPFRLLFRPPNRVQREQRIGKRERRKRNNSRSSNSRLGCLRTRRQHKEHNSNRRRPPSESCHTSPSTSLFPPAQISSVNSTTVVREDTQAVCRPLRHFRNVCARSAAISAAFRYFSFL
jgi:hypothetical protein